MRRATLTAAALAAALALPAAARADDWHSEQPAPPPGTSIGVPVPLGAVGDIEFWAPNRGLLTTAGNDGVPAGVWAYDGTGWNEISTVCGGHDGRIAWAAANEWWTIADQPAGQVLPGGGSQGWHVSLCHFVDGQVVASYAEPIGTASSYLPLDAAACSGPSDCWFAGDRLPGTTNVGAFHLHWDGQALTAVPSLTTPQPELRDPPRSVESLAHHQGKLYESVQVQQDDVAPSESADQPFVLHEILPGSSSPFLPLFTDDPLDYGGGVQPWQLSALRLTSDGGQLWALGGALGGSAANVVALRLGADGSFGAVALDDPDGVLAPGTAIDGAAADPGSDAAWVAYTPPADASGATTAPARLVRIHADGTVEAPVTLPAPDDALARKGSAGPIACPAPGQCWMATSEGWLFHLGGSLPQDGDPILHRLVTYRPPDDSTPFVPPTDPPIDDSGANPPPIVEPDDTGPAKAAPRPKPLAYDVSRRMVHRTTLVLTFRLRARAHVQLVALRRNRVVARTARVTLKAGRHTLRLRLDPRRWPTKLDLRTSRVTARGKR